MNPTDLQFRWEDPVDERWNAQGIGGGKCVAVGRIRAGQVVARIFERLQKGSTWMTELTAEIVYRESEGGKFSKSITWGWLGWPLIQLKENVEDQLFGHLRDWYTCWSCGALTCERSMSNRADLVKTGLCFYCMVWFENVAKTMAKPERYVVAGGRLYAIGEEKPGTPDHCKGFGGRRHEIVFNDGRRVVSTNLWSMGEVPPEFRSRFSDNARFEGDGGI